MSAVDAGVRRGSGATAAGPTLGAEDALQRCVDALLEVIAAADDLGVQTDAATAVHGDARRRMGFPGDAYVLALIGGTGVGKSSLLNALAGSAVSPASARRPTTSEPVAWVPMTERSSLGPLLAWLGVGEIREHPVDVQGPVAILDLPDIDSIAHEHRERVEAILPRVDAVAWVVDPEKYHDAALHDTFLRSWLPRLSRQVLIVNKADRISPTDADRVRRDLERDLGTHAASGQATAAGVPVMLTSAAEPPDIEALRTWIANGSDAKAVIRERLAAASLDAAAGLGRAAGLDPNAAPIPLLDPTTRSDAVKAATRSVLAAIDVAGLEHQAVAATRARARARGTGPMGRITSLIYRLSGRETHVANPDGFLVRWRERGALSPAVETLRSSLSGPVRDASPAIRPRVAAALDPGALRRALERAVDRSIATTGPLEAPTSNWWSLIGFLQTLATVAVALSAAWVVVWILARPATGSIEVPLLGPVPTPFVALVLSMAVGYLLARILGAHAGWLGRRWARGIGDQVARSVDAAIREDAFQPIDTVDDARSRMWAAWSRMRAGCGDRTRRTG